MRCILYYNQRLFNFQQDPLGHSLPNLDADKMVQLVSTKTSVSLQLISKRWGNPPEARIHFFPFRTVLSF